MACRWTAPAHRRPVYLQGFAWSRRASLAGQAAPGPAKFECLCACCPQAAIPRDRAYYPTMIRGLVIWLARGVVRATCALGLLVLLLVGVVQPPPSASDQPSKGAYPKFLYGRVVGLLTQDIRTADRRITAQAWTGWMG